MRTTDGGGTFMRLLAPPVRFSALVGTRIVFADRRDGYVVTPTRTYVTHDGGERWLTLDLGGTVESVTVGGGAVYATVNEPRSSEVLLRSPVGLDRFKPVGLALDRATRQEGFTLSVAAAGRSVFVLAASAGGGAGALLRSRNWGRSFTSVASARGCLAGTIAPEGTSTLWMQCVTGMMSGVGRSTDAGRTFRAISAGRDCNCAVLGAASSETAIVGANPTARLELLTGGGRRGRAVGPAADPNGYFWSSIQFADRYHGLAVRYSETAQQPNQLWLTADGGHHWSLVRVT